MPVAEVTNKRFAMARRMHTYCLVWLPKLLPDGNTSAAVMEVEA